MNESSNGAGLDVLIVGAGPTGLVLALWLARMGARVRIVDKTAEPGTTSRALAVQARTLELYRQVGFADAVVPAATASRRRTCGRSAGEVAHAVFGELGAGMSPFPFALIVSAGRARAPADRPAREGGRAKWSGGRSSLGFEERPAACALG